MWTRKEIKQGARSIEGLPEVQFSLHASYSMPWEYPSLCWIATVLNAAGEQVGFAKYAVTSLDDQLFIYSLQIDPAHRGQGYATAALWYLQQLHGVPITPVQVLGSAQGFWNKVRQLSAYGLYIGDESL